MPKYQKTCLLVISILIIVGLSINASAEVYGGPFDNSVATIKVDSITPDKNGQAVILEGVISALCQGDGCWLSLKDDTGDVMVDLKPYDFRIPMDSTGKKARIYGEIQTGARGALVAAISIEILE